MSAIALFSEPIPGDWTQTVARGSTDVPCLIVGLITTDDHEMAVIVVPDGSLRYVRSAEVATKWRWDDGEQDWVDLSAPLQDDEDTP